MLMEDHKLQRVEISQRLLQRCQQDNGDEIQRILVTLDRLKEAIRRKRPGLLRRGVVLQHDNATPHSANLTQQWLQRYGWEILPHPAHSLDLAASDFHLFGPLKRHLGGMAFETEDDLISELRNWFDNLDVDFFRVSLTKNLAFHLGTAHPHILKDGSMIYYGTHFDYCKAYNFISIPTQPESSEATFEGAKIVATIPSRWKMNISYTHSFGITENYFIHLEQPLTFNIRRLMMMGLRGTCLEECMVTHQDESMDILVIDRATGKRIPIAFKAPNGFVFHFINCYEDLNHIVFDACFYPSGTDIIKKKYLDYLAHNFTQSYTTDESVHFARFVMPLKFDEKAEADANLVTLPYTTATAVIKKKGKNVVYLTPETIEGSPVVDLPRINYDYNGMKYRYFYGTSAFAEGKQLSKFDLVEKRVLTYDAEKNLTPGEPVFLARPGATKEDDGVVVSTLVADSPDAQSFLVVLDAESFQEVGRASLPHEVKMSLTFHGNFTSKVF
ncbi:beta,beta-carotene 15,15'-monooxygenase [Plakobranchus ocellatus]|uniref:Beta,beta-carotene 15,15'-monooxygenase n=1 Tax=Plakobranchus ocellatus TaxID=259542 RepID=A0AAV4DA99_9GAST|nr:beta,beta-carotene 15,15'-monooxygenase [Plakobranchus ocellatus]